MPTILYPFDPNAQLVSNYLTNVDVPILGISPSGANYVIPPAAPFFEKDLDISHIGPTGIVTPLQFGVDYVCAMRYNGGRRACGREVWGCVSLLRPLSGSIRFNVMRTMGYTFLQTPQRIAEIYANSLYNPREVYWEQVAFVPTTLPAANYPWDVANTKGMDAVCDSLNALTFAIARKNNVQDVGGLVLSGPDDDLLAGMSKAHRAIYNNQTLVDVALSCSVPSTSGNVLVMPKVGNVDLLEDPVVLPQGLDYIRRDPANAIRVTNLNDGDLVRWNVINPGIGVRSLTAYLIVTARQ